MPWWPRRTTRVRTSRTGPSRPCSRSGSSRSVAVPRTASWWKSTRKPAGASRSSSGPSDRTASESPTTPPTPAGRSEWPTFILLIEWKWPKVTRSADHPLRRMDFPPFEHLLYYEKVHVARLNISFSNIREFHLDGFRRKLPKDLDLNWPFRNGTPELRRLIANRHRTSPKRVLVTTGATEANFLVNASLVHPRERVLVDVPIYSPLRDVPRGVGAKVVEIPRNCEDGWRLDLDRWRKTAGRRASLLVFANLNNPTSPALPRSDLRELADIAEECDGRVLVDETFRELAFQDKPPSAAEFGPRMIALSTVTKVCGLGTLRVGWIVGAPDLLDRFAGTKDYTTGGGSVLSQTIATWALGRWDFFLRRAKRILDVNRKLAAEALRGMPALPGGVPSPGTALFPPSTVDVARLASRLLKRSGDVLAESRFFGVPDHFRLGLGGETQDLKRGLANLRRLLRSAS